MHERAVRRRSHRSDYACVTNAISQRYLLVSRLNVVKNCDGDDKQTGSVFQARLILIKCHARMRTVKDHNTPTPHRVISIKKYGLLIVTLIFMTFVKTF